jgi:hypothetical protein
MARRPAWFLKLQQVSIAAFAALPPEPNSKRAVYRIVDGVKTDPAPQQPRRASVPIRRDPAYRFRKVSSFAQCNVDDIQISHRTEMRNTFNMD